MRSRPSNLPLIHCPGAVPLGFGRTVAPSRTSACLALFGDIFQPRAAKRCSIRSRISSSRRKQTPRAWATASRVRSSSVGSQSAAENHDLRAEQRVLRGRHQTAEIVPHNALKITSTPS
jgi:hypothetical protein